MRLSFTFYNSFFTAHEDVGLTSFLFSAGQTIALDLTVCRRTASHLQPNAFGFSFLWLHRAGWRPSDPDLCTVQLRPELCHLFRFLNVWEHFHVLLQLCCWLCWVCSVSCAAEVKGPCTCRRQSVRALHLSVPSLCFIQHSARLLLNKQFGLTLSFIFYFFNVLNSNISNISLGDCLLIILKKLNSQWLPSLRCCDAISSLYSLYDIFRP